MTGGAVSDDSARRGRIATAAAYFIQGLCFAVVVTRTSVLQDKFHLSNGRLTLVLLVVPLIAGVGSVACGPLAARLGSRAVLRVTQPLVCLLVAAIGYAATQAELYAAVGAFGLFLGAVDATMNMQGAATERRYGYSVLTSFYGVWSVAGITGGVWNAIAGRLGMPLGAALASAAAAGLAGTLVTGRMLHTKGADVVQLSEADAKSAGISIPWRPIVALGSAMACAYVADAAVANFSSVYLSKAIHASLALLPLGYAAYQGMTMVGRVFGDRAVRRYGAAAIVRAGAVTAALGLLAIVLAPSAYLAIAAFGLAGLGFCVVVPQCFSATSKLDPAGSGIAISRVNVFNYAGYIVGAALAGGIAGIVGGPAGWRSAFLAPLALTGVIIALAGGFQPPRQAAGAVPAVRPSVGSEPGATPAEPG